METMDRTTLCEWLDLHLEGQLRPEQEAQLKTRLAQDPVLAVELQALSTVHGLLAQQRIAVQPGFKDRVLQALPVASWEPQRQAFWVPLAAMVLLAVSAALFLSLGREENHLWATGSAVFDFLQAGLLAGAGLLTASWRGLGMGLEELITSSMSSFVVFVLLVLMLDFLVISLLRRRAKPQSAAQEASSTPKDA